MIKTNTVTALTSFSWPSRLLYLKEKPKEQVRGRTKTNRHIPMSSSWSCHPPHLKNTKQQVSGMAKQAKKQTNTYRCLNLQLLPPVIDNCKNICFAHNQEKLLKHMYFEELVFAEDLLNWFHSKLALYDDLQKTLKCEIFDTAISFSFNVNG